MHERFSGIPGWVWAAAAVPRAALFAFAAADPAKCLRSDSLGYLAEATNLLRRGAFSSQSAPPFAPETTRTPGYAVFLAPFVAASEHPGLMIAFAHCVLGVLTAVLVWRWCSTIGGKKGAALGALVLALDPVLLFHTPLVMTEIAFQLLFVVSLIETWESKDAKDSYRVAACGLLWSWCSLLRPIAVYLPPLLAWRWRKNAKAAAVFLLAAYALPAALTARNWRRTGIATFSSQGGRDLLRYPAAGIETLRTGKPWTEVEAAMRRKVDLEHASGYASDAEQGRAYGREAMGVLRAHPAMLARYCAWGAVKVLSGGGLEMLIEWITPQKTSVQDQAFHPEATGHGTLALLRRYPALIPLQILYAAALAALYGLFAIGLRRLLSSGRTDQAALLFVCAAYFLALSSSQGYYRYRIPLLPLLAAGAAASFSKKKS
ncbi:MAG: glycosyltransferase family 39 protein [Elusimicrobia bacterium]|nr:glycosyltransferase family 39 protein [Elusimicrobiota bacterium]